MDRLLTPNRRPTDDEARLIFKLVKLATNLTLLKNWEKTLLVEPLNDGGMGSLKLIPQDVSSYRRFGGTVSQLEFLDADGVVVSAALNVDQNGQLFELDIWKTDFSQLLEIPKNIR